MGRLMPEVPAALAQNEVKMFCLKSKNPSKDHLKQHEEQKHSGTLSPGSTSTTRAPGEARCPADLKQHYFEVPWNLQSPLLTACGQGCWGFKSSHQRSRASTMAKGPALLPQAGNLDWPVSRGATDVHASRPEKLGCKKPGKASGHPGIHLTLKLALKKNTKKLQ